MESLVAADPVASAAAAAVREEQAVVAMMAAHGGDILILARYGAGIVVRERRGTIGNRPALSKVPHHSRKTQRMDEKVGLQRDALSSSDRRHSSAKGDRP